MTLSEVGWFLFGLWAGWLWFSPHRKATVYHLDNAGLMLHRKRTGRPAHHKETR